MKKRILSIVLAICLVLFCVPITVFAADEVGDEYAFLEVLKKGGTQKLNKDYNVAQSINVGKTIVLDLNGHVVHLTNNSWLCVDRDNDGVTLTIKDSKPNEVHSGEYAGLPKGGVICADGKKNGGTDLGDGGCLYVESGTLILESGTICNGYAQGHGGAIANKSNFIMNGGTITNCSSKYGGAVANLVGSKFTMNGGTITNCTATASDSFGGGSAVSLNTYSEMIISGSASIHDNPGITSMWCAGNIYAHGGTINGDVFLGAPGNQNETFEGVGLISKKDDYTEAAATVFNGNIDNWGGTISYGKFKGEVSNERVCQRTMKITGGTFYAPVTGYGPITGGIFYSSLDKTLTVNGTCYTVSFNLNGGSGSISPQRFVNTKTSRALRPTNPKRSGYVFKGWYNGSTKYTFAEPVTQSITLTAEWINTSVSTETDLKQLIDGGIPSAKLADDITLSSTLDLSDKDFTLDLNGHVLKGNIKLSDSIQPVNPSKLTLIDSNPTATHTDSNLPLGGVLDGEINLDKKTLGTASLLCANGGTVMGRVNLKNSDTQIGCTSATPTAFMDGVEGSGAIHGGMFYGGVKESCIEEKTVTFLSDGNRYAVGVVESGKYAVAPVDPVKDGYVLAGWYMGNIKYEFTQPVMLDFTLNAKWVIENVSSEDKLREAIDLGSTFIKLQSDIRLSSALDLSQKDITIDLNGYVISGADISINTGNGKASLTLTDSRPNATHGDSTLPLGGAVTSKISMKQDGGGYNDCVLYANGGTVTSEFSTNTNAVAIKCTSNTPTAFKGKISGYTHLYGGIYYGAIASSVTIEGKKITFKNGNNTYAYEVVDSGNNSVAPISPSVMTGYQAFDGWYNGNTKYTFGSSLSQDITLTAKYKNPLTYNITYNLGGGTATNPTSYTVESDAITLNNPTKTGYTFTGWSGTGLSSNTMTVTVPKGSTGNRTYTANYSQNSYTVAFDTVGGNAINDKTGVKWTDKVLDGITNPTKNSWEFTGWKCGDVTVTANTTYSELAGNDTVTSVTLVAQWKDITAPTGEISIGTNSWKSFLNTITFGLFFKDTQTVTITASDNSGDAVTIEYLPSGNELNQTELANRAFTAYTKAFSINPDNKYVVYAKLTDTSGNVTYINSDGIVLDSVVPVISGIENGKTYCEAQTVTVTEEYIKSVTVNGTEVTLDENKQFTLPAKGIQTIVVTDKAGNETSVTVTVNNGHIYEWQDDNGQYWKKCKFCGDETAKKDIPTVTINGADTVCITQEYKFSFTLPQGATDPVYGYEFENKGDSGLPAIIENNELFGIVPVTEYEPSENSFKVYAGAKTADGFEFFVSKTVVLRSEHTDATPKDHICDICGVTVSEHTGGEATCTNKAICEYCGNEYGELDSANHNLEKISAKDATVTETGNTEYWCCFDCGKYFSDENGTNEIKLDDTVTKKLPPEIIEGKGQSITAGEKKELTFRSNAAFSDFIRVELDGKTLDEKNYTVKEGSTVVTLKADYVATLSAGEHTIGIVSESGTAATTFTVNAKAAVDNDTKSPQTGDNSMMWLWVALLFVSGGLLTVTGVYRKKKRSAR